LRRYLNRHFRLYVGGQPEIQIYHCESYRKLSINIWNYHMKLSLVIIAF